MSSEDKYLFHFDPITTAALRPAPTRRDPKTMTRFGVIPPWEGCHYFGEDSCVCRGRRPCNVLTLDTSSLRNAMCDLDVATTETQAGSSAYCKACRTNTGGGIDRQVLSNPFKQLGQIHFKTLGNFGDV